MVQKTKNNYFKIMDNNNTVYEWPQTPAMFLTSVLADIQFKHRPDFAFRENSISQETSKFDVSEYFKDYLYQ